MADIIGKGIDIIKEGFESLKNIKRDKLEYKKYLARIEALPEDYRFMYQEIQKYMWSLSMDGSLESLYAVVELFENAAAEGKTALEFVGSDAAAFCDALLQEDRTWQSTRRELLNKHIQARLGK